MAEQLTGGTGDTIDRSGSVAPPSDASRGPGDFDLVFTIEQAVRRLFSVTLTVSSARSLTDGVVATRLDDSLEVIDDVVASLHRARAALIAAADESGDVSPSAGVGSDEHTQGGDDEPVSLADAARALATADEVLTRLWADAVANDDDDRSSRGQIEVVVRYVRNARLTIDDNTVGE